MARDLRHPYTYVPSTTVLGDTKVRQQMKTVNSSNKHRDGKEKVIACMANGFVYGVILPSRA